MNDAVDKSLTPLILTIISPVLNVPLPSLSCTAIVLLLNWNQEILLPAPASLGQTGEGEATWFQHSGNTYIVIDNDDANNIAAGALDTYNAGKDVVIEITGLVDLSTASFNATTGTLEIA